MSATTYEEVLSLFRETDQRMKETDRQIKETGQQMKETGRHIEEMGVRLRELERVTLEQGRQIDARGRQIDKQSRQIEEQGRHLGGIGDKFGYFTEGMALPSMERILAERFAMTFIMPRVRIRKNGETMEIDVLAYANDDVNLAIVVEVKSRVRQKGIEQLRGIMARFRDLYPEHKDKGLIAILAGVAWDQGIAEKAREEGFLTAAIRDEVFQLTAPEGFEAKRW